MTTALRITLGCLLSLSFMHVASAMEPGTYKGMGSNGEDLSVAIKGNTASIEVTTDGCVGVAEGKLKKIGEGHWQMRPEWPGCVIDFRQKGNRFTVKEAKACFQLHGAMCTFNGTVTGKTAKSAAQEASPSVAANETWTYGNDQDIGLSAHIRTPEGAVGLACIADGTNAATAEILALRFTNDIITPMGSMLYVRGQDRCTRYRTDERETLWRISRYDVRGVSRRLSFGSSPSAI